MNEWCYFMSGGHCKFFFLNVKCFSFAEIMRVGRLRNSYQDIQILKNFSNKKHQVKLVKALL